MSPGSRGEERRALEDFHAPHRVLGRIRGTSRNILGDAVLGATDGAITTFAVVAGSIGAGFPATVIIVLGFASLMADGLSMAVSNFLRAKSERDRVAQARRAESRHIDVVPGHQEDEVRHIFAEKGFSGETLERIVQTITQDRRLWIDTVVSEEFGLQLKGTHPLRAALATFVAFLLVGSIPLVSFLLPGVASQTAFVASIAVTALAFLAVGMVKGHLLDEGMGRAGLQTLVTGSAAAVLAFAVGHGLQAIVGVA